MQLSTEQAKKFLRIQRKHNVSVDFILHNMPAILKFVQYATTPHVVLRIRLIRKRNRIFLRHNYVQKLLFDPSQLKRIRRAKRVNLQWSKRLVMYLRRFKTIEFFEDEMRTETKLPSEEVSKQLKEQLELLKSGKRTVPLFVDTNNLEHRDNDTRLPELVSKVKTSKSQDADPAEAESVSGESHLEVLSDVQMELPKEDLDEGLKTSNGQIIPEFATISRSLSHGSDRPNGNFLDMLMTKVKKSTDNLNEIEAPSNEPIEQSIDLTVEEFVQNDERESSNSSSDFFGFDDSERVLGTFPGMLSTPLVRNGDFNSAFESETLNAFMRDNSLESSATVNFPQRRHDDGLVCLNSIPPKLDMPVVPEELQVLRTVAERRSFLQRSKNLKYGIVNNVGTIFRELQKRVKGQRINKNAIEALQTSGSVPLTRQGWKAASWLLTDEGNYYFQTMLVDGTNVRLFGCRGNREKKMKNSHSNDCLKISSVCTDDCMDRLVFRALRPIRTIERRSKLKDGKSKVACKACPLSQKVLYQSKHDETTFGSLEIVRMPQVELEVFPQLQKPLPDIAKRYLQLILPFDGISREWAEFSVSTLVANDKMEPPQQQSFAFPLPYANDRNHVLVRRVYNRLEAFEGQFDKSKLSFRKEIDKKRADGEPPDILAEECADILTDMLNSVAISCSENSFLKNDPDNIYQYGNVDDIMTEGKLSKKSVELHHHQAGGNNNNNNKRQNRLLNELKRLNATIIDAAAIKSEEGIETNGLTCNQRYGISCDKQCCRLGCVCASLNEGTAIRQHCGKQRCILECNCKCPGIMRVETDGRTITTEDAFMLRRQATARLARMEKDFTSTVVLTGSETLLINESQYDKKRRCTKIPKRYGDFVDPDASTSCDSKSTVKRSDTPALSNLHLDPIMVKDKIYQRLRHCRVYVKRLRDVKDLAPWCMVHMVYKCYCKGQATDGNPIVLEKQEELTGGTTIDEAAATKNRTLYSFDKEETKASEDASSIVESECSELDLTNDDLYEVEKERSQARVEKRGRLADNDLIHGYMNAKANHCRRVVPIPRNLYLRRNKKRIARVQLFIAEHETDETRLSLNEHVLRSVYYHRNNQNAKKRQSVVDMEGLKLEQEENISIGSQVINKTKQQSPKTYATVKRKINEVDERQKKKSRISITENEHDRSLLHVDNHHLESKKAESVPNFEPECMSSPLPSLPNYDQLAQDQITVPKISQIFSLNSQAIEMGTDSAAAAAADIPRQSTAAAASAEGVTSDAFKNVFQVVIKNMNNLVSKKMQDIDMALRRESKAIPAPNDEILCIIRWNNFLEAFMDGYVYLWEVRTSSNTFMAATVKNIMPLVVGALSVVNLKALPREVLPLLGRMLIDKIRNPVTEGLAVVMQGQKMYWFVKGFLRPDKSRICPKPTPESHPLLTRKINILCRLLINQQINEHKKRQEAASQIIPLPGPGAGSAPVHQINERSKQKSKTTYKRVSQIHVQPKIKVLPMQRNISEYANKILEQMVSQAYGVIATNLSFRKVLQAEVHEVYQPAHMSTDHYWLVLDLSNDFSHIFIPELKDLLTLDRIQKVIAYAVDKNRIVKMQFCEKALFNAYVTPMSRRKLYFGPFRGTIQVPKLILLQSVDGQMMLREVYEARHNVAPRTERTTAFWLIQKDKKLIIDIESNSNSIFPEGGDAPVQIDVEEIIDDDVIIVPDSALDVPPIQIGQSENINNKSMAYLGKVGMEYLQKAILPNGEEDDCILIEDGDDSSLPVASTNIQNPSMLAASSTLSPQLTSVAPSSIFSSSLVNPTTVSPSNSNGPERINYTISYTGENSSLVVVRNECELVPGAAVSDVQNNFTILDPEIEKVTEQNKTSHELPQGSETLKKTSQHEKEPDSEAQQGIVLPFNDSISAPNSIPKAAPVVVASPPQVDNPSKLASQNSKVERVTETIASVSTKITNCGNLETDQKVSEKEPNALKLTAGSIKWNKNITIKKILNESGSSAQAPKSQQISLPMQKLVPATNSSKGVMLMHRPGVQKVRMLTPLSPQPRMRPAIIRQTLSRPRVPNSTIGQNPPFKANSPLGITQQIRQPVKQQIFPSKSQMVHSQLQRTSSAVSSHKQSAPTAVRPATSPQGTLIVRTPSAINTYIKTQQQQQQNQGLQSSPGSSLLKQLGPGKQMRPPPTMSSLTRASFNAKPAANANSPFKNSSQVVDTKKIVAPVLQKNLTKPSSSPPKNPLKRVFINAKLPPEGPERAKLQRFLTTGNSSGVTTSPLTNRLMPQSDPLHISEELSNTVGCNLPQPKLPNDLKAVRITSTPLLNTFSVKPSTPVVTTSDMKTKPVPAVLSRSSLTIQNHKQSPAVTETTTIPGSAETIVTSIVSPSTSQAATVKGIPIKLPRLKKFEIIASPNTTVITPPTGQVKKSEPISQLNQDQMSPATATEQVQNLLQKRKTIPQEIVKCLPASTASLSKASTLTAVGMKNLIKVPPGSNNNTASSSDAGGSNKTEIAYGYFYANIQGLPKFVSKRVNDDFLIKVPHFNGILKLPGLETVHNYLNQYAVQKCGKSTSDIKNIKWTFKPQDRSKINTVNKSNMSLVKSGSDSSVGKTLLTQTEALSKLPAPVAIKGATVACEASPELEAPIILLDDK